MDISEQVLFTSLAQLGQKNIEQKSKDKPKAFEVIKPKASVKKVDVQYLLERKLIESLLLYGNKVEDFEDLIMKENEKGDIVLEPVIQQAKVFEKIFLDLQEDEMEFSNSHFKTIYYTVIDALNQNPDFELKTFINTIDYDMAYEISNILMEDERYTLDDWERMNIIPKKKQDGIAQLVSETILTLRCFLIDQKILEFQKETLQNKTQTNRNILEEVKEP